jgi:EF hand associated
VVDPMLFRSDSASSFGDNNDIAWDLRHVNLKVVDTEGKKLAESKDEIKEKIRMEKPDVIMLCYSHGDPTSITRLANHWLPSIWEAGPSVRGWPNVPVCLTGLKTELFNDGECRGGICGDVIGVDATSTRCSRPFTVFLLLTSLHAAPTFTWVDTLETCQTLVTNLFRTNPSLVPGAQEALASLEQSLVSLGGSQVAINSAREYYNSGPGAGQQGNSGRSANGFGSNYSSPDKRYAGAGAYSADAVLSPLSNNSGNNNGNAGGAQGPLDADTCWHLCMSLLMSAWPNVHDQCEVSVFEPEPQEQQQQAGASLLSSAAAGEGHHPHSAAAKNAALSVEVCKAFHKVCNLVMHPVYPLFCPPYLQQAQSSTSAATAQQQKEAQALLAAAASSNSTPLPFPGAVSTEDPSGFCQAYNRIFHLYATQLPVSSTSLAGASGAFGRDSRDSTSNNTSSSSLLPDPRFFRMPLAAFKALSRRTNGATLTESEMQQSMMSMRRAEAEENEDGGDPDSLVEIVGTVPQGGDLSGRATSEPGHAQMLLRLPGLRQFLRNFVIFGYTTHAWQVLRRHGYVLADPQSTPLAQWANDREEAAWLSSTSAAGSAAGAGGRAGRRLSFSNPSGAASASSNNGGRTNSSGVYEVTLDWRNEFGCVTDKSIASPLSTDSAATLGSYFSTATPYAVDCSLAFNRDGIKFLERLFREQLAAQAEKAERAHREAMEVATAGYSDAARAVMASAAASMGSTPNEAATRTWLSRETIEELFASTSPAGKHPFNTRLFPDVTRHNVQGGFTMQAWLNLWRMLLVTSPETCLQALYCVGFSKSAGAPGTAAAATVPGSDDHDESAASSVSTSTAGHSLLRPMLKGVLGGSVDPTDDPRQAVKIDVQRKFSGPMVKSSVRRLFVVGSRGCGKSTLILNYTCQGKDGFEEHLKTAPNTRNGGAAPAPTNVPTHYVVEPPQAEDVSAIAGGRLPPSATIGGADGVGSNLSPAAAAFAAQREEARRKALPDAFVITVSSRNIDCDFCSEAYLTVTLVFPCFFSRFLRAGMARRASS